MTSTTVPSTTAAGSPPHGDTSVRPRAERVGGRAAPLPPDERRAALVAATLPLVLQHGTAVSTRQIADAAGVAEGTIFRVFASKDELVAEAVAHAFDPSPAVAELAAVDPACSLETRLVAATEILQRRLRHVFHLLAALRLSRPPEDDARQHARDDVPSHAPLLAAVAALVEPDRGRLRVPPAEVARLLRLLTFAGTHPHITDGQPLSADEIVTLLLDGVRSGGRSC